MDTQISKLRWLIALSLMVLPFQNCSVYQSPQRKLLEEKGIAFLGTSCEPFVSPASIIEIFGVSATTFVDIIPGENSVGRTCKITVPGAPTEDLGLISCFFSASARSDFNAWLSTAYSGSTRNPPASWTKPDLESGEVASDRRFTNFNSMDSQSRVAEGYLRLITQAPDTRVMGFGAFRTSGAQVVQCSITMRSADLTRTLTRVPGCSNWDVSSGGTPPTTISAKDQAQCLVERITDLFIEQTK
ncbi:MAG: hypothetical protein K2X47_13410 [Bdellovibrionales bacterium]|nr:hypothetical protein [Bdellovibrionales bacterium]